MKWLKYIIFGVAVLVAVAGSTAVVLIMKGKSRTQHANQISRQEKSDKEESASHESLPTVPLIAPRIMASNVVEVQDPVQPVAPPITEEMRLALRYFKNPAIPADARREGLKQLGLKADSQALQILTTLGNEKIFLNWAAVEALGAFKAAPDKPAAETYLKEKLKSTDSQLMCAAIRAYTTLLGKDAVTELTALLKNNHLRPDGHHEIIRSALVKALVDTTSSDAIPILQSELDRNEEKEWSMEYGSELVAALAGFKNDRVRKSITAYADKLEARKPADALAKEYFDHKIKEARNAAN